MHSYEEYNKPIQELIKLMQDDYPNDYILEIDSFSATLNSKIARLVFLDSEKGILLNKEMANKLRKEWKEKNL